MQNPLITVVTPSFNQDRFIEETILSVLNQTYKNIQYIIVDGGSTDNTMDIVEKYRDKIDIIIHEKDKGQADAINKGFKLAKGELVGWINSDDILYPDCVEKIINLYQEKPNNIIYYSSSNNIIDKNSTLINTYRKFIPDRNYLLNKNYDIIQQASFYKTEIINKINYLDINYNYCMDLDLWLRLLEYGPIASYNEKPLGAFRNWEETKTQNGGYHFLIEIRKCLIKNGVKFISANILKTLWYEEIYKLKDYLKKFLGISKFLH